MANSGDRWPSAMTIRNETPATRKVCGRTLRLSDSGAARARATAGIRLIASSATSVPPAAIPSQGGPSGVPW
jgi:hypothetical protein